jgi:hypothetical protein
MLLYNEETITVTKETLMQSSYTSAACLALALGAIALAVVAHFIAPAFAAVLG